MDLSDADLLEQLAPLRSAVRPLPPYPVMLALVSLLDDDKLEHAVGASEPCAITTSSDGTKIARTGPVSEDAITGTAWQVVGLFSNGLVHVRAISTIKEWNVQNDKPGPVDRRSVEAEAHPNGDLAALGIREIGEERDEFTRSWKWSGSWHLTMRDGATIVLPDHQATEALAMELRRRILNQQTPGRVIA